MNQTMSILLFWLILGIDFITKKMALKLVQPADWSIATPFVSFRFGLEFNQGIALSLLKPLGEYNYMYLAWVVMAVLFLFTVYIWYSLKYKQHIYPEIFVASGGIANLLSRLEYKSVIDFLEIRFFQLPSFIINFADIFIFLGVIWLFLQVCYEDS